MGEGVIKNQIRRLRFEHGEMTQQELAERAGCTRLEGLPENAE